MEKLKRLMDQFDLDEIQLLTLIASGALEMSMIAGMQGDEGDRVYFTELSETARDLYNSDLKFY